MDIKLQLFGCLLFVALMGLFTWVIDLASRVELYLPEEAIVLRTGPNTSGFIRAKEQTEVKFKDNTVQAVPGYKGEPGDTVLASKATGLMISCCGWAGDLSTGEAKAMYTEALRGLK